MVGFSLQGFLYGNHRMPGEPSGVWHNNLRFKSNLGYISKLSARPPTSSGRSVLSLLLFLLLLLLLFLPLVLPFPVVSLTLRVKCGRRGKEQRSSLEVVPLYLIDSRALVHDTKFPNDALKQPETKYKQMRRF